jgi:hypothetical protein
LVETDKKEWYLGKYEQPYPDTSMGFKAVLLYAATKEEKE